MDFNNEETMIQMVHDYTRTELRAGGIEKSCIDHISTNCPTKCSPACVIKDELCSSDHFGITIKKYTSYFLYYIMLLILVPLHCLKESKAKIE